MEWIGGAVIGLSALVLVVMPVLALCFPKSMAGFIIVLTAILVTVICIVGAAILVAGIIIVNVIQKNLMIQKLKKTI